MNLIVRITILFALVSLLVFAMGGVISYRVMMREVIYEQQRFLVERLERVENNLERLTPEDTIQWAKLIAYALPEFQNEKRVFSDTMVVHAQLGRMEPHLRLDAIKNIDERSYLISLYDVIIEEDDIRDGLTESLIKMYLILLSAVLIIGFGASYYILRPFNLTLAEIRKFSIKDLNRKLNFPRSNVKEFKRLNRFLSEMTEKVKSDYRSLKEFSENASHEFQTPIAIIQSKLEVLMNAENLTEEQLMQISDVQNAMKRLSNLSNSLALLTKIENEEFKNVSDIDASELLSKLVYEFKELFKLKNIDTKMDVSPNVQIKADQVLVELLLTNLINNAIRHNWEGGNVSILLDQEILEISNSGPALSADPNELFQRFKKSNQSASSMGLGLAIVKKICDFYGFNISYVASHEQHTIKISF